MGLSLNFTNWMAPNEREREDDEEGIKEGMKELNALLLLLLLYFLKIHPLNLKVQDVSLHFDFNTR